MNQNQNKKKNKILHDMDKIKDVIKLLQKEIDRLFEDTQNGEQ